MELQALRQFVKKRENLERCDLCASAITDAHPHLFDSTSRRVVCACRPCSILFGNDAALRFRLVPERVRQLRDFQISDADWASLMIPITLAFFVRSSSDGRVRAFYPSPGGPTESELEIDLWPEVAFEPDVEALLVNRLRGSSEAFIVPIDRCYKLVGIIRTRWRGLSGGADVWKEIARFFEELRA